MEVATTRLEAGFRAAEAGYASLYVNVPSLIGWDEALPRAVVIRLRRAMTSRPLRPG